MNTTVPIPRRMRHLDRDPRGYPIPVMVFRDDSGRPHFTVNGEGTRGLLLLEDQCSICGQPLDKRRWFVGGPMSAFHPQGSYYDPPLHHECMRYAMRVCPYLALPSYTGKIEAKTITQDDPRRLYINTTQDPTRPAVFCCVESIGHQLIRNPGLIAPQYVRPNRPYRRLEFWKDGRQLTREQAIAILSKIPEIRALVSALP